MSKKREISKGYNPRKKLWGVQYNIDIMLNRTLTMFRYTNLPESLPERELEKILQINGYGILTEHEGELVALWGGWAPPMDVYYMYKNVLVNNPWAKINRTYEIGKECVLVRNDPLNKGLIPILRKYGTFITETELTMYLAMINFRALYNIKASNDREKESAELFLKKIEDGEQGVLLGNEWSSESGSAINTLPYATGSTGYITQIIELMQYLKGSQLNELGLNANYNMKRERLSASETDLNEDSLRPLIDAMLEERKKALAEAYKIYPDLFPGEPSVEFNSSWSKYNENETLDNITELIDGDEESITDGEETEISDSPVEELAKAIVEEIADVKEEEEDGKTKTE